MATIVASAGAALVVFARDGSVDWGAAAVLGVGSMVGAWLGARYLDRIPERRLTLTFGIVLLVAAARLWFA